MAHWLVVAGVSIAFESLFVHHGIAWLFDEGWPLYAAMRLHQGGTLYADTFFLFPPGHVWPAWIAYALDPPGVVLARIFYSVFNVAACLALYGLGRRLMPARFALLAALLLAVAAPRSHLAHLLFGYRYTVFALLGLLAFGARLRGGGRGWMFAAGLWTGVALVFRLTPAFAVACGIGVATLCAQRDWRESLRDLGAFAAGTLAAAAPVLVYFAAGVGLDALWDSAVVRILPLQSAQSKPVPELFAPAWGDREGVSQLFVALQYRLYPLLYGVTLFVLARRAWTSFRGGRDFEQSLLLAVVIFGAVFFLRTLGRSDEHHLTSALPPTCLLLAYALDAALRRLPSHPRAPLRAAGLGLASLAAWIFLQGSDRYLDPTVRGVHPLESLGGEVRIDNAKRAKDLDGRVEELRRRVSDGETFLDLTHAPLLHVLTGRSGPGYDDVVTPGVFADPADEERFVRVLERDPPAVVIWPRAPFDRMPSRSPSATAPRVTAWIQRHHAKPDFSAPHGLLLTRREH
jgi:hypothetical protein